MNIQTPKLLRFLAVILLFGSLSACVKKDFDSPPSDGQDPNLTATMTIAQLKALYTGTVIKFTDDVIIKGTVIADDKSGNFYKTMVIQDETGGMAIRLDQSNYYTIYPIGRRVFIKCKGLVLGDYSGYLQIGGFHDTTDTRYPNNTGTIPSSLISKHLIKGQYNLTVAPTILQPGAPLDRKYQSMLVRFEGVEFQSSDAGQPFANAVTLQSVNRTFKNCGGKSEIIRSSGYSNFATTTTPTGNGYIDVIYSEFGGSKQMVVRDAKDAVMNDARCGSGPTSYVTIAAARAYYTGSTTAAPAGKKIKGIVISDKDNTNTDGKNCVIQDSTAGIVVRFTAAHNFPLGAEVEIDISAQTLLVFSGLLEFDQVDPLRATQVGTGSITPRVATIADILANFNLWESTLVKVNTATITGTPATYSGSKTITDASGNMTLYTRSQATFSGSSFPATTVSVTGVLVPFNTTKQISIRNLADVQ